MRNLTRSGIDTNTDTGVKNNYRQRLKYEIGSWQAPRRSKSKELRYFSESKERKGGKYLSRISD